MSRNTKRKLEDFDPNKSDSDDEDYDNAAPSSARSRKFKAPKQARPTGRGPAKRKRQRYGDSDDDIEDDDDDLSDEEEASFSESEPEDEIATSSKTGRRQRAAARRAVNYEETSEEDEIQATSDEEQTSPTTRRRPNTTKQRLIVKLRIDPEKMQTAASSRTRRTVGRQPTPEVSAAGQRRSSRISRDSEEPLVQLTNSGKHTEVARPGSRQGSEEPIRRASKGGKGLKTYPSAIMEVSQEDSGPRHKQDEAEDEVVDDFMASIKDDADMGEADELADERIPSSPAEAEMEAGKAGDHADDEDEDDDDGPVIRRTSRTLRARGKADSPPAARRSLRARSKRLEQSSDFEPNDEEGDDENLSDDDDNKGKGGDDSDSGPGRRSGRLSKRTRGSQRTSIHSASGGSDLDIDEIADEAADLEEDRRRNKRPRRGRGAAATRGLGDISYEVNLRNRSNRPDYRVVRPETALNFDDDDGAALPPAASQGRGRKANAPYRTLFSTLGPFGGAGGPTPVFGGAGGAATAAAGGADSDSSDDDNSMRRPSHAIGGAVGMTPTQGQAPFSLAGQPLNQDPAQAGSGAPANFGKVKDRKALADADPLGVDPNVNFDGVGGMEDHIDRLKEMVALPLLYPEIFMRMHVTPPRGVLFHGPPGTGKTLLARALASSVSSHGKKVTFYMRKGADALSKWVGEAERQLRLLFEEARKNQPSIIFFDEIDGLAPVRSSKQEQIHASIVATLLALMDGMDGRGQVIVIGATNRPDSVDPALRRPGRFDREFYFPLPNKDARKAIINIHTKGWEPPLKENFKTQLAELTKGYGGADLRALCAEAALNAVQGTFPQIYSSDKKLLIDPSQIKVLAKDFMISVNKIIPSSERSASSGSAPLKKSIEPLLRENLRKIEDLVKQIVPVTKKRTALEEAQYDDREDELGFEKENLQREFEGARIFRPRLLIFGMQGMGQQYLGAALLNKFEGMYVANFDLPSIYKDSTRSPEAAIVQMFEEVKRHKPSVIYIPNIDVWYHSLQDSVIRTFTGLLRSLPPTDPVLLLGIVDGSMDEDQPDKAMMRDLFGYSSKNCYFLERPDKEARREYFSTLTDYIRRSPAEFPDPENRKKRDIPVLPEAPAPAEEAPKALSKEELKNQKRQDRHTLNSLKLHIQQVMDQIKLKYKKFRTPPIDERAFAYLFEEQDPEFLTTDIAEERALRPYRLDFDKKNVRGLREVETGKFYYNLEIVTIEQRLSNGYYKRPSDFLDDIKRLAKDAKTSGDQERILKANELYANVEVDMINLEKSFPALAQECENVYQREKAREAEAKKKSDGEQAQGRSNVPLNDTHSTDPSTGPIHLGVGIPAPRSVPPPFTPNKSDLSNGYSHDHSHESGQPRSNGSAFNFDDVEMSNSQDTSGKIDTQQQFTTPVHGTQQKSQHSSIMQMAPGSQARDYINSASTTTSGQKTSDRSNRDSGHTGNTQHSNGLPGHGGTDFSTFEPLQGSQLPDTQEPLVGSQATPHSSPGAFSHGHALSQPDMPPPPRVPQMSSTAPPAFSADIDNQGSHKSDIDSILNHPSTSQDPTTNALTTSIRGPTLIPADANPLAQLTTQLVESSSGLSVEQLEQVMASLMAAIWNTKRDWNRNNAVRAVMEAFNETIRDVESVQRILKPSQEDEEYGGVGAGRIVSGVGR